MIDFRNEEVVLKLQDIFWSKFREYSLLPGGLTLWQVFLKSNKISSLLGVDASVFNRGQDFFVLISCPVVLNCSLKIPREFAEKALMLGGLP